jgi:hypothetical protein
VLALNRETRFTAKWAWPGTVTTPYEDVALTPWPPATPLREPAATEPRRTHPADRSPGGAGLSPAHPLCGYTLACGGLRVALDPPAVGTPHRTAGSSGPRRGSTDSWWQFPHRRHRGTPKLSEADVLKAPDALGPKITQFVHLRSEQVAQ